ncbi:hypothetical protein FOZ63_030230, partial [Perkinsus olseni]
MSLLARLFGCKSQDSASSCFGRPGVPLVSEIEIFCRYGKQAHSCFVESNTDPVYAFEYTVQPGETPGDISAPITRGCRLGLTDGIVGQGDDFTEVEARFDIYDDDGKHGPFPVKWIPTEGFGTYKFAIDKKRYAVFIHYYMLAINVETKETTVLRVNGVSQHPKGR